MKRIQIKLLACSFIYFFVAIGAQPVFAANPNFATTLSLTYTVSPTGQTQVTHVIELINKTPTLYAKQYGLKVSSPNLKNVKVSSNGTTLNPEVVTTDTQTSIGITFPDEVVGEGKNRKIEVTYQHPDAAIVSGKILEVLVPKMGNAGDYDRYSVTLITPASFGQPTRVTPAQYESRSNHNTITTTFNPRNGESVTALFGEQQVFDLKLRYHLENESTNVGLAQIALPPDTAFQKIGYQMIDPEPLSMNRDADGNWIANYEVPPQNKITVNAQATVLISLHPAANFSVAPPSPMYIQADDFWETNDVTIKNMAKEFNTPRTIHDYIVKSLTYNYAYLRNNTQRLGAIQTLANPDQAACQEFTDTFIALARAAQIPARRLTGYAYTQNPQLRPLSLEQDILHAWPEYWDAQNSQWTPIDPTWENTTGGVNYFDQFDLNHIVFAIHGASSQTPFPAGGYKGSDPTTKDVEVTFAQDLPQIRPQFLLKTNTQNPQLPGSNHVQLLNTTGVAWYNLELDLDPQKEQLETNLPIKIPVILPFQALDLQLPLYESGFHLQHQTPVQLTLSYLPDERDLAQQYEAKNEKERQTIQLNSLKLSVGPKVLIPLLTPYGLLGLGISGTLLTLGAGSVLVFRRKRSSPIRRKSQKS